MFLCGILLYQTGSRWWMLPAAILLAVLFYPLIMQKHYRECMLRGGLLLAAGILGAGCQVRAGRIWQSERQTLFREQQVSVCGTLIGKEEQKNGWQLTLELPDYQNRVIVSTQDGGYPLDCILSVNGSVREFDIPRNEGQFNQRQYYKCRRVMGQIRADEIRCVKIPQGIHLWRECLYLLRTQMCRVYEVCLPETSAGMMAAMVTGEKTLLDADVRRMFQRAGFSHILAISGMHISLIGMGIYRVLRKGRCTCVFRCAMTMGFLILYGTMIGWGVSARRAIGMFGIYLMAQYLGRGYDLWSALSVVAVVVLADNPFLTGDMGFRFSFVAVAALAVSGDMLSGDTARDTARSTTEGAYRWLHPLFVAGLLQLATLPLVAYSYYELPVYALLLNLLLIPYAGLAVGCGLLGGLVGVGWCAAARVLLVPCRIVAAVYVWTCGLADRLPYAALICGRPSQGQILIYYLLLATALLWGKTRYRGKRRMIRMLPVAVCLIMILMLPSRDQRGFEISYLDVGQGDGAMIRTASGAVCFVDGGSSDVTGVGTYRILPFLKSKGIRAVDYWLISHADEDHVNGFYEVLEAGYDVRCVVIANDMPDSQAKQKLLQTVECCGVPLMQVKAGQTLYLNRIGHRRKGKQGETARECMRILAPVRQLTDSNAACMVCLYEDAHVKALFTGDIGAEEERELLERGLAQPVDLYKAAHHGSRYSNTAAYVAALSPKLSVISCARRNRYGHPSQEAVENIRASGSYILYTMYSGQIKVRLVQGGLTVCGYVSDGTSENVPGRT